MRRSMFRVEYIDNEDHLMDAANELPFGMTAFHSDHELVEQWLGRLDGALQRASRASLAALFARDGHWRDLLALTWSITPCHGAENIAASIAATGQP